MRYRRAVQPLGEIGAKTSRRLARVPERIVRIDILANGARRRRQRVDIGTIVVDDDARRVVRLASRGVVSRARVLELTSSPPRRAPWINHLARLWFGFGRLGFGFGRHVDSFVSVVSVGRDEARGARRKVWGAHSSLFGFRDDDDDDDD